MKLLSLCLTSAHSIKDLGKQVRQADVIAAAQHTLRYIHMLAAFRHGSPPRREVPEFISVRVYLAAYLMVYKQSSAFERMRALETALLSAAAPLVERVRVICEEVSMRGTFEAVPFELTKDFNTMLYAYVAAFVRWKAPDELKLCTRLRHRLNALYDSLELLGESDPALLEGLIRNAEAMRSTMQQVSGIEAVLLFDRERRQTKRNAAVVGARWPRKLSEEQLQHEMLLDSTFQLPVHSAKDPISKTLADAFWRSLVSDLTLPNNPCFSRVIEVLREIKRGVHPALDEALDLDFIEDQADAGVFTWDCCVQLMRTIHSCVPADAEELEACPPEEQAERFCKCLRSLLEHTHAASVKDCNYRLRRIAGHVQERGVQMEQRNFQAKLDEGTVTLERVKAWLLQQPSEGMLGALLAGLLSLLLDEKEPSQWPETLALDVAHLQDLRTELQSIGTAATMMVVAREILNGASNKEEAGRTLVSLCARVPTVSIPAEELSDATLRARLEDSLLACTSPTHAVRCVM